MIVAQMKAPDELLRQRAAAAFGEQRATRAQLHAALEIVGWVAILADAHVAGGNSDDAPVLLQQFGGWKPWVDFHAQSFRLLPQPAAYIAERNDVVAGVVHLRRRRQPERAVRGEIQEPVVGRRRLQRRAPLTPVGDQLVEGARLQHRAGQDMRADLAALLHQADRGVRRELLQPDSRGEARWAAAHDDDVELHCLPRGQLVCHCATPRPLGVT